MQKTRGCIFPFGIETLILSEFEVIIFMNLQSQLGCIYIFGNDF